MEVEELRTGQIVRLDTEYFIVLGLACNDYEIKNFLVKKNNIDVYAYYLGDLSLDESLCITKEITDFMRLVAKRVFLTCATTAQCHLIPVEQLVSLKMKAMTKETVLWLTKSKLNNAKLKETMNTVLFVEDALKVLLKVDKEKEKYLNYVKTNISTRKKATKYVFGELYYSKTLDNYFVYLTNEWALLLYKLKMPEFLLFTENAMQYQSCLVNIDLSKQNYPDTGVNICFFPYAEKWLKEIVKSYRMINYEDN